MVKRILAAVAGAAIAAACYPALSGTLTPVWLPPRAQQKTLTDFNSALPPPPVFDATPARLLIPAIGVDATVEARGLDGQRNLATPADFRDVAWYELGPRPGEPGNAIVNGHVNWWTGDAVFTNLHRLRVGDVVRVVQTDGRILTFKVTSSQTVDAGARLATLFAPSVRSTLTLITCSGVWDPLLRSNTRRLLVTASLA